MKTLRLALITIILLASGESSQALVMNGDFETGDISGWSTEGQTGIQSEIVHSGNYAALIGDSNSSLSGTQGNWISQTFDPAGMNFVELWYNYYELDSGYGGGVTGSGGGVGSNQAGFQIQVNGSPALTIDLGGSNSNGTSWMPFTHDLSGYPEDVLTLTIYSGSLGESGVQSFAYVDDVRTFHAPEPATMLLLGSGLAGLVGLRRRIRS